MVLASISLKQIVFGRCEFRMGTVTEEISERAKEDHKSQRSKAGGFVMHIFLGGCNAMTYPTWPVVWLRFRKH